MSLIRSGIAPLDHLLGGVLPGRLHLLTGGPGTGKTSACLQFLQYGLRHGEAAGLVTVDRSADLAAHARSSGIDLAQSVRANRLLLVRFSGTFTTLLESSGSPDPMIDDLSQLIADIRPVRLAIDPLTPFLAERSASGSALARIAQALEDLGLTTILTYPGDVSAGYDARLDPVVQRAAAIVHLARDAQGTHRMRVVQSRSHYAPATSVQFAFRTGAGLVMADSEQSIPEPKRPVTKRTRKRVPQPESST